MMKIYEGMFLLDNQAVRADWRAAKGTVTAALEKHGGQVVSARRWDERKLAYPIRGRRRGTYLLSYYNMDGEALDGLRRELEITESVLRYLILQAEAVPEGEIEKSNAELEQGFSVPPPPEDDEVRAEPEVQEPAALLPVGEESAPQDGGESEAEAEEPDREEV
jgi:small subunit ribosomal protein S6